MNKSTKNKTEVENMQKPLLTGCNVCGRNHYTESCSFLRELKPIQDTKTPSRARLTLPANLEVQNLADNSTTVVARAPFFRSVQFGPFIARHTQMLNPAVNFPLKVFGKNEESNYFLDTSDEETCNWMCLVAPATNCKEQNLICYQMGQDIYYTVMKDIQPAEQLRVWYAPYYAVKMGAVPFNADLTTTSTRSKGTDHIYESKQKDKEKERRNFHGMLLSREVTQKLAEQLPAKQLGARRVPDTWRCRICSAEETSVVSFAKHLMSHYKRSLGDRLLECHICQQKFATEKLLVKHKVVRHKMVIQRPRLLENMEEEESAVIDTPEEDDEETSDILEENGSGMTSIVIANLTGELPSQYSQPGAQTIFVTNSGQIFADSVPGNEMQDRQNDALNVLLEQLQASDPYRDISNHSSNCNGVVDNNTNSKTSQAVSNGKEMQETVFSQNDLSEKDDNSLGLTDTSITNQYESMEEEQQEQGEESESMGILGDFKPTTTVALNAEQNNGENIINIINTHVTLLEDREDHRIMAERKSKSADIINEVDDSISINHKTNKNSEIHDSIFEAFQTSNHTSKDLLSQSSSETGGSIGGHYQMKENPKSKDGIEVNDIVNGAGEVNSNVSCLISSADIENDEATSELQLSVGQDDVSSAFLELVSAPNFGTNNNANSNKELENNDDGEVQSLQDEIQLLPNFDLESVPEEATLLSDDHNKMVDMGPPYNCDICNKEFHKADYLYRHLRKHTGEFTCVSCLAVFARKESLINHICFSDASVIAENASFTCPYCQKKYLLKKLFKRHMAKHTGEWKCDKCQRFYSSKTTLSSHRCTKKPSPTYKCQVCKKEFLRHSYLDKHMLLHLECHPCSTCGKKLPSGEILDNHQLYCERGKLLETVGETTCPHCTVVFSQLVPYRQHIYQHTHPFVCQHCGARFKTDAGRTGHTCSDSSYSCEVCKKSFSLFNLSRHQVMHGVPQFHCYECGRSFLQSENFSNHNCILKEGSKESRKQRKKLAENRNEETENFTANETGEGDNEDMGERAQKNGNAEDSKSNGLVCDICGEIYKTIHILKAHMQLHGERKFCCEICNKKFHRKDVLQEHRSVHREAQIPCPVCNKKLKTKKSLDVHMHRHTGEKRYTCNECGKKFFQKGNLLKHAVVHNPNAKMILTCDHCNKNFTSRDYLAQHMLEHTQGRIHLCHICDKGFVKEHMLRGHIKKMHGGSIYICPYCNMTLRHRTSMRRHLGNRHSEQSHEWGTPGFIHKLEADDSISTIANTSLPVSQPSCESNTIITTVHNTNQIASSTDLRLVQPDAQTEGAEILLTVSGVPLSGSENEVQTPIDQTVIGDQMELQVETEIQGDEVSVGNAFIFSDGTIVQQEDGTNTGEIFLYVLDSGEGSIEPGFS